MSVKDSDASPDLSPGQSSQIDPQYLDPPHVEPPYVEPRYVEPLYVESRYVEPWMRGTHSDVPALARAVLHALELAIDDIAKWTTGLTDEELHSKPLGISSVAFHLKHIAGSVDRILCYAEGRQLSAEQLALLKSELTGEESLAELIAAVEVSFSNAAQRVMVLANADMETPRGVGRKMLPTSVGGALVHVADHTMRHIGQVVSTCQVLRALRETSAGSSVT